MIDRGVNPFVVSHNGDIAYFDFDKLDCLLNLPSQKSVYFTTRPLSDEFEKRNSFPDPWFYETGVFDGKFNSVIGQGAAGTVVSGGWFRKKAAFKFVKIDARTHQDFFRDSLRTLNGKLSEMISIQSKCSKIVKCYGHYR